MDGSLKEENESKFDLAVDSPFLTLLGLLPFLLLAVNRALLELVIMQIFVKTLTGKYSNIVFLFHFVRLQSQKSSCCQALFSLFPP